MFKLVLALGGYLAGEYDGRYYARAMNMRERFVAAYDVALDEIDAIALPTTPFPALESIDSASRREVIRRGRGMATNCKPFNITDHPAVSLPAGTLDGRPIGLMLVGRRGEDADLLQVAREVESRL